MINPLRRRNRGLTPEQSDEVQRLVFELVKERMLRAFGPAGTWSVSFRDPSDTASLFGETVAETLAWDVAAQLGSKKPVSKHQAPAATKPEREAQPAPAAQSVGHTESRERLVA